MSSRVLAAVLFAAALTGCATKAAAPVTAAKPAVTVRAAAAEVRSMAVEIQAIGKVEPVTTIAVRAQVSGTLLRKHFNEGDLVKAGARLFDIDARPFEQAVEQWESTIERDKATIAQSNATLQRMLTQQAHAAAQHQRYERLAKEGIFSREQAEQMAVEARSRDLQVAEQRAAIDSARASLRTAETALASAKLQLSYCTIVTPITGRTGSLRVQPGNLIKAMDSDLVTIHQLAPVDVTFAIPEERLGVLRSRLRTGAAVPVSAAIPGDTAGLAQGRVQFLDNAVDTTTGTIRLKGSFANGDARLWPGQFVNVRLLLGRRDDGIVIPSSAVQTGQAGTFVYVVKPDGAVEVRPVVLGARDDQGVLIERGLGTGERVVTEGHLRVAPGVKVRVAG